MVLRLSSTMDIKSVASVLNVSVDEIEKYIKKTHLIQKQLIILNQIYQ